MTHQPPSAPPGLPSPGQPTQPALPLLHLQEEAATPLLSSHPRALDLACNAAAEQSLRPFHDHDHDHDHHAHPAPDCADLSLRANRSSFPFSLQNDEMSIEVGRTTESLAPLISDKHFRGGAWKDDWVVSLIRLRGSMDEEFLKPQKPGIDMWSKVSGQLAEAHEDFDKNSESCRKKWQRVYKSFKDDKALLAAPCGEKYLTCKWFDLVEHYMHNHVDLTGRGFDDQPASLEIETQPNYAHASPADGVSNLVDQYKLNVKRARKDQKVKESLSRMVETWRESLEVLRDSEAKRLEILQTLSNSMAGLLDVLRK